MRTDDAAAGPFAARKLITLTALATLLVYPIHAWARWETPPSLALPQRAATQPAPAQVLELVRQAQEKSAAKDWKAAAALWERIVQLNPVQPEYWYALGNAHYYATSYKAAIPAYEKAAELGAPVMGAYFSIYNMACCHALLGNKEVAVYDNSLSEWAADPSLPMQAGD